MDVLHDAEINCSLLLVVGHYSTSQLYKNSQSSCLFASLVLHSILTINYLSLYVAASPRLPLNM